MGNRVEDQNSAELEGWNSVTMTTLERMTQKKIAVVSGTRLVLAQVQSQSTPVRLRQSWLHRKMNYVHCKTN